VQYVGVLRLHLFAMRVNILEDIPHLVLITFHFLLATFHPARYPHSSLIGSPPVAMWIGRPVGVTYCLL